MSQIPSAVTALLAAGTLTSTVSVPWLIRTRRHVRDEKARATGLEASRQEALDEVADEQATVEALVEETAHLAQQRVPALLNYLTHPGIPVPGPLHPDDAVVAGVAGLHDQVLSQTAGAVFSARRHSEAAAAAVMRGATSAMQALGYRIQTRVSELQTKFDDPFWTEALLELDQLNEMSLRKIQTTGLLCGSWTGLNRDDSHLGDIVAGAVSRIQQRQRVLQTNQLTDAKGVVGRFVEPLVVVTAELLDNATAYSLGSSNVVVDIQPAGNGACIIVDDAGPGLNGDELAFAQRMLDPQRDFSLIELRDPPRAGFAVVGQLSREFGFSVNVGLPSPYGGSRAVVFIPDTVLVVLDERATPASVISPPRITNRPPAVAPSVVAPGDVQRQRLPQRTPAVRPAPPVRPSTHADTPPRHDAFNAWRAGTETGRQTRPEEGNRS